jgi:hypothetical protein
MKRRTFIGLFGGVSKSNANQDCQDWQSRLKVSTSLPQPRMVERQFQCLYRLGSLSWEPRQKACHRPSWVLRRVFTVPVEPIEIIRVAGVRV